MSGVRPVGRRSACTCLAVVLISSALRFTANYFYM